MDLYPNCKPRGKGRFDPDYLPFKLGQALPVGAVAVVVGEMEVANPYGGKADVGQALEVTLANGTIVPAYRRGEKFAICQNFAYKAKVL